MAQKKGYIYIVMNKTRTVNYTGVTAYLKERINQHREGKGSEFTRKYNLKHLVYFEEHATIQKAIEREKQLKNWNRSWKMKLIRSMNPHLRDLWDDIKTFR